ncbi:DNA-binding protein [Streptomyces sp. NPDC058405]|uniref:DNA-binding protein n=1 Tax=Streptomyces sp. NPDC058405 TaxID=3346482 RepID=UPI00364798C9
MTQPEPYAYTDPFGDKLSVGFIRMVSGDGSIIPSVAFHTVNDPDSATAYVPLADEELVVAAIRTAAGQPAADRADADALCARIGTPYSGMRIAIESPDGWPASRRKREQPDARRNRYATALRSAVSDTPDEMTHGETLVINDLTDAALAVADEEQRDLRAELDRARAELEQARATTQRVCEWVTSDVVTARSEFGNGYREAQRDIRDIVTPATTQPGPVSEDGAQQ